LNLVVGLMLGVAGTLLIVHFTAEANESTSERLEEALHCDDGPINQTAATASRTGRYSVWAATHAVGLYGIGCDAGAATILLEFSPYKSDLEHALATMRGFGPVCVVNYGFFDGRLLKPIQLEDICAEVGGEIRVL
jgi:hypothetical protein